MIESIAKEVFCEHLVWQVIGVSVCAKRRSQEQRPEEHADLPVPQIQKGATGHICPARTRLQTQWDYKLLLWIGYFRPEGKLSV